MLFREVALVLEAARDNWSAEALQAPIRDYLRKLERPAASSNTVQRVNSSTWTSIWVASER